VCSLQRTVKFSRGRKLTDVNLETGWIDNTNEYLRYEMYPDNNTMVNQPYDISKSM